MKAHSKASARMGSDSRVPVVPADSSAASAGKPNRVADAYQRLKIEIMENRLSPGFQMLEQEAAEMLEMSRTPVREALIRLQSEGLVRMVARRGFHVLPVYPEDMRDIYQLLIMLEPAAAGEVARRGLSAEEKRELQQASDAMETALEEDRLHDWAAADDNFHRLLLSYSDNDRLVSIVSTLFDQAHRARMITLYLRKKPVQSTAEHSQILEAILDGNAKSTCSLFKAHRERAAAELLEVLKRCRLKHL